MPDRLRILQQRLRGVHPRPGARRRLPGSHRRPLRDRGHRLPGVRLRGLLRLDAQVPAREAHRRSLLRVLRRGVWMARRCLLRPPDQEVRSERHLPGSVTS